MGLDEIPSCLLKDGSKYIVQPLSHIINCSLITGIVPSEFKQGKIIPIYKSGKKSDIDNYRPITIFPVISKVLEKCVFFQIITYLEDNNLDFIRTAQLNCQQLCSWMTCERKWIREISVGAVFIDLRKAFNTVSHSSIVTKLPEYGIIRNEKEWLTNYLFGHTQCVTYENCTSSMYPVFCGVLQGLHIWSLAVPTSFQWCLFTSETL